MKLFKQLAYWHLFVLFVHFLTCYAVSILAALIAINYSKSDELLLEAITQISIVISVFMAFYTAAYGVLISRWFQYFEFAKADAKRMDIHTLVTYHQEVVGPIPRIW